MKLILSVFIVLLHSQVNIGIFTPFLRVAVPLFFITSAYFFFGKIQKTDHKTGVLLNFLKRNMILYGFWFVLLLPVTLYVKNWFSEGLWIGLVKFLQSLLFNSTFRASWYLMALNVGICLSLLVYKKLTAKQQLLVTLPVYLICCLSTNYFALVEKSSYVMAGYQAYIFVFRSIANSFPASLFWIAWGRWFAERGEKPIKKLPLTLGISSVLLVVEHVAVAWLDWQNGNDSYIMLIPFCVAMFGIVKNIKNQKKHDERNPFMQGVLKRGGNISTIIYVTHASIIAVLWAVFRRVLQFPGAEWVVFGITLTLCLGISAVFFCLERFKWFKWLKYAY
jgi:surface polysaccharide O-acyltransferase-like enzyme